MAISEHGGATLLLFLTSASVALAQLSQLPSLMPSVVNVTTSTTNLPGAGPVYKREDTLAPVRVPARSEQGALPFLERVTLYPPINLHSICGVLGCIMLLNVVHNAA
jgi:hypothetical protein